MKIACFLTTTMMALPIAVVDGYYVGRGPPFRSTSRPSSPQQRAENIRRQQERVNRAFEDLQEDLRRQKKDGKAGVFVYDVRNPNFSQSGEEYLRKQKEWINRALDLASEFNADFAPSEEEGEKNDEFLRKSRDWINRMYGIGIADKNPAEKVPDTFEPRFENLSTNEKFEVLLDVPGVAREDIDISVEEDGKALMIQGERNFFGGKEESKKATFSQTFDLDETVDTEKISARLNNGVLVVSAPKEAKEEKAGKKIPIL